MSTGSPSGASVPAHLHRQVLAKLGNVQNRLDDVSKERDLLRKALRDIVEHGLRCDMNPAMNFSPTNGVDAYSFLVEYFGSAEKELKTAAQKALDKSFA